MSGGGQYLLRYNDNNMNINVKIKDAIIPEFVAASKWKHNNPAISDEQLMKRAIRKLVGIIIDEHKHSLKIEQAQQEVLTLEAQRDNVLVEYMNAHERLSVLKTTTEPPTVVDEE